MSEKDYVWSCKKLRICPFCGKRNTFCDVEKLDRVFDEKGKNYYQATIHCHHCGATVHGRAVDPDLAVDLASNKWEHRVGDDE